MRFDKREFIIDGHTLELRYAKETEAKEVLDLYKKTVSQYRYFGRYPDEIELNETTERRMIRAYARDEKRAYIIALVDGKYAGSCAINPAYSYRAGSHIGKIGIALLKDYVGKGYGKIMMQTMIELSVKMGYRQLLLEVMSTNARAIRLYGQFGFEEYGRIKEAIINDDGSTDDVILMKKQLLKNLFE